MNTQNLKPLPWAPRKGAIYEMYWQISKAIVRTNLKLIIKANRKLSDEEYESIKYEHSVLHAEFEELIELLGLPKGYKMWD